MEKEITRKRYRTGYDEPLCWEKCTMKEWDKETEGTRNILIVPIGIVFVRRI